MPSTLVIFNPTAGRGRVRAQWPAVEQALRAAGVDFDTVATQARLDAVRLAREAAARYTAVISVGGDGTLHEIVNGLLQASNEGETIALGVVPLGNGDDFAKVLPPEAPVGGKPFTWPTAVAAIARGQTRLFDAGRLVGDPPGRGQPGGVSYFMNGMDVGFGAHAAQNFTTIPRVFTGMSAYMATVLKTLVAYPTVRLRVTLDDQPPFEQATTMTAITIGRCFANGFWVCPQAQPDDGLFDLMVAQAVSRLTILGLIPKIMKGAHTHEPVVKMLRARRVLLESPDPLIVEADGELPYLDTRRLEVEVLPRKLKVLA
jgi:YegS/Rv2252/BmrU family lipid kinase